MTGVRHPLPHLRRLLRRSLRGQGALVVLWPLFWYLVVAGVSGQMWLALASMLLATVLLVAALVGTYLWRQNARGAASPPERLTSPRQA